MDKFREKYIALQKAFWDSDGGAASVAALYEFKDELEKYAEKEAKTVLVDVYELLGLKKSACELLGKICNPKDKKQLKKLGYLKQYGADGDVGAVKRPKTASEAARQSKKLKALPHFRYHPDPFKTGVFKDDASVICECCEQATDLYYCGSVYCVADVNYLCPHCIASGAAAAKFDAGFIQDADPLPPGAADAQDKTEELFKRTPGYFSWQGGALACLLRRLLRVFRRRWHERIRENGHCRRGLCPIRPARRIYGRGRTELPRRGRRYGGLSVSLRPLR